MERKLEPVDLIVAVGLFATIVGACSFFIAANGGLSGSAQETSSPPSEVMSARQWVQPALGQSIVEEAVLSRKALAGTRAAAFELVEALGMSAQFQQPPSGYLKSIVMRARTAEQEQAARVQHVIGQMVVNMTARGVRNGHLSASDPDSAYNRQWLDIAQSTAKRMDAEFQAYREANLGTMIIAASIGQTLANEQSQERLGAAMVRMAQVQDTYGEAIRAAEVQTAAVIMAALRTETLDGRLRELAEAEPAAGTESVPYVAARNFPEIPVSILVAGSAAAIGVFLVGLMWPSRKEGLSIAGSAEESSRTYRKTG
jgi:hypothetical protein